MVVTLTSIYNTYKLAKTVDLAKMASFWQNLRKSFFFLA